MADGTEYVQKAYQAIMNRDYVRAIEYFKKAIASEPDNASYHYKLSITYARSNMIKEALNEAETAVRLNPNVELYREHVRSIKSRYLTQRVFDKIKNGHFHHDMIHVLKDAIMLNPLNTDARLLLADIHRQRGERDQAYRMLYEILRLNPNHKEARRMLMQLYHNNQ